MAVVNLKVFKQGKPIYWIVGAVVLFVLFYFMLNKSAPAAGGTQYVSTGPSEALQAAQLQAGIQSAQIQASANVEAGKIAAANNAAVLSSQVALAQLSSGEKVALFQLARDADVAALNAETNLQIASQTMAYNLESARVASQTAIDMRAMETQLLKDQMNANAQMFAAQSNNLITQTLISATSNLKKKDRDDALAGIGGYVPVRGGASGGSIDNLAIGVIGGFL